MSVDTRFGGRFKFEAADMNDPSRKGRGIKFMCRQCMKSRTVSFYQLNQGSPQCFHCGAEMRRNKLKLYEPEF